MQLSGGTIVWRSVVTALVAASLFFLQAALAQPSGQTGITPLQAPAQTEPIEDKDDEDKSTADFDDDETSPTTLPPVGRDVVAPIDTDSTEVLGETVDNESSGDPNVADDMDAAEGIVGDPQFTG